MNIFGITLPPLLARAARECKSHFLSAGLFSMFVNLLYLAPAIYMLQVYDRVVPTGGIATLAFVTLALAIALLSLSAFDAVRLRLLVRASLRLDALVAPRLLKGTITQGGAGTQAMRDFDTIRTTVASPAFAALFDVPWLPIFLIVSFMLHFWIGVLAIVASVAMLALAWANQRVTRPAINEATATLASAANWTQGAAMQGESVRALGMTSRIVSLGLDKRSAGVGQLAGSQFDGSRFTAAGRFLRMFVQSAALGLGALLAVEGKISSGAIIAASIVVGRALQPVDAVISGWGSLMSARAATMRLSTALENEPVDDPVRTRLPDPKGQVSLDQVGLRMPDGRPILFGVSMDVRPGEAVALIGPSGSGKTSLSKIIVGATEASVGTVRIDGAKLSDWDPDELGRHIGYIPQQPSLLEGTIRDNICRFDDNPNRANVDAHVVEAAKLAGVHELVLHLPQGYETVLGPMGQGLSAGQAQRIALARALYGSPALLVLDEPNSWLDTDGDVALANAVKAMKARGSAVIIAAHRKTVLEFTDKVMVLESGRPRMYGETSAVMAKLMAPAPTPESAA
ncbi:type I secretion system permease/ATPase [Sphingomonas sabuli]|uniref:Type I secretion system permease/ATPase n=1 Tax=Sphingomonas sabuli TaxID=2764186 RepID=A0A7G9L586_9SPHN|nr:type I secretion system permease/ATPase [Sphingomonas sabuli]QNM83785.1 type I secretion system permease/ATPase [Sphingomonas sabuli]